MKQQSSFQATVTSEFMNQSAEELTGLQLNRVRGMPLSEVLDMTDIYKRQIPMPVRPGGAEALEELDACFVFLDEIPDRRFHSEISGCRRWGARWPCDYIAKCIFKGCVKT